MAEGTAARVRLFLRAFPVTGRPRLGDITLGTREPLQVFECPGEPRNINSAKDQSLRIRDLEL